MIPTAKCWSIGELAATTTVQRKTSAAAALRRVRTVSERIGSRDSLQWTVGSQQAGRRG